MGSRKSIKGRGGIADGGGKDAEQDGGWRPQRQYEPGPNLREYKPLSGIGANDMNGDGVQVWLLQLPKSLRAQDLDGAKWKLRLTTGGERAGHLTVQGSRFGAIEEEPGLASLVAIATDAEDGRLEASPVDRKFIITAPTPPLSLRGEDTNATVAHANGSSFQKRSRPEGTDVHLKGAEEQEEEDQVAIRTDGEEGTPVSERSKSKEKKRRKKAEG